MKYLFNLFFFIALTSCNKDDNSNTINLKITAIDSITSLAINRLVPVSDAKVKLYLNYYDQHYDLNAVYEGKTDTYGQLLIQDLPQRRYFVLINSECLNNYGRQNFIDLTDVTVNTINMGITMFEQSTLIVNNLSKDQYYFESYGLGFEFLPKGYSVKFLNTVSVGEHKLRFVQKTGIKIVPRDTTIYAIVKCGEITTVDFR